MWRILSVERERERERETGRNLLILFLVGVFVFVSLVVAIPYIDYDISNPADNTITSNKSVEFYVNITEANLKEVKWNWNGTNYSVFDEKLVLAFNFDNVSALGENDTHVFDISGNGNNGTLNYGALMNSNGKYNGGLEFHGTNTTTTRGEEVTFNNPINNEDNWTISFWVKPENYEHSDTSEVLTWGWNRITFTKSDGGQIGYNIYNSSGDFDGSRSNMGYGNWIYVSLKRAGINFSFYVNGEYDEGDIVSGTISDDPTITLGSRQTSFSEFSYLNFNGTIDDLLIYNKTLSSLEIRQLYLINLKKYDVNKWSLYVNQSMATNGSEISYDYFACATNSSDLENCTEQRTITRVPTKENLTSNYGLSVGDISNFPYGSNVHNNRFTGGYYQVDSDMDGSTDSTGNSTEHADAYLNSRMNYMRGDMDLGSYYDGVENPSFEYWENKTLTYITTTTYDLVRGWAFQDNAGGAWISPSTDSHTGTYSLNITCNESEVYMKNYFQNVESLRLENYKTYNASIWIKGDGTFRILFQDMDTWGSCGTNIFTITSGDGWVQKSVSCTTTTVPSKNYRFILDMIYAGENILVDDFNLQENGVNRNWWYDGTSLSSFISLVEWANENDITFMPIASYMPTWLANRDRNCSSNAGRCPPYNATLFGEITVDWINRTTSNGTYSHVYEIEVWNEPEIDFFMPDLATDHIQKSIEYNKIYNATYDTIKLTFPNMPVGGTGASGQYRPNMQQGFLSNFSDKMDFYSFHRYSDTADTTIESDLNSVYANCSLYNANCSRVILSEWQLSGGGYDETDDFISKVMGSTYIMGLNNYPANLTWMTYQWTESYTYGNGSSEYPSDWKMFLESQINGGNAIFNPQYNTTKAFATYCPAGATVYNSTSTTPDLVAVSCKKGDMYNTIVINKGDETINLTLNFNNFTQSTIYDLETRTAYGVVDNSTNIGSIDQYEIIYLGSDLEPPVITINSPANVTSTLINITYFNLTLDEEGGTCYYSLDGASNITMTKQGTVTKFKAVNSSMTEGSHTVVFSCNDTWNNWNSTQISWTYTDTAIPVISFSCSPTSLTLGETMTCSCSATDAVDLSPSVSYTANPSTSVTGTFTTTCTATDDAGNSASSSMSYSVGHPSSGGGSSSFYRNTFVEDEMEFSEVGIVTKELKVRERVRIMVDGEEHYIGIVELTNTTATVEVFSTSQKTVFNVGDEGRFEVTGDDYYDIFVRLNSIGGGKANLTIGSIREGVVEGDVITGEVVEDVEEEFVEEEHDYLWLWVVLGLVGVLIGIVLGVGYWKKEK